MYVGMWYVVCVYVSCVCMASVNFHLSVGGNNPSEGTVDGIEFASENQYCKICVLCNNVVVCCFVFCYPVPRISMLGICCGTCELDSITRSLNFVRQPEFFPTLKLGVGGESPTRCKGVMVFTCELDSIY